MEATRRTLAAVSAICLGLAAGMASNSGLIGILVCGGVFLALFVIAANRPSA